MGYHRLLTHRGYKTPKWVEYFLTTCGTLALEGGPIFWVATHRIHHQYSDKEGDPHSPREGTYWAHMGWIFTGKAMHHDTEVLRRYVPDLSKDRFHVALTTWHWVPQVVVGLIVPRVRRHSVCALGGLLPHDVRPALHLAGQLRDAPLGLAPLQDARRLDEQLVGCALTFGEGWHNNHHAHPVSTRHGLAWYEIDINYYGIKTLEFFGLAWDLKAAVLPKHAHKVAQESPDAVDISDASRAGGLDHGLQVSRFQVQDSFRYRRTKTRAHVTASSST